MKLFEVEGYSDLIDLAIADKNFIWRGTKKKTTRVYTPRAKRQSPNTPYGIHTIWCSNHPSWKNFPKRNDSFICSLNKKQASMYGDTYLVIPLDQHQPVGVAPFADFWDGFDPGFNNIIIPEFYELMEDLGIFDRDWVTSYIKLLKDSKMIDLRSIDNKYLQSYLRKVPKSVQTLYQFLDYVFDPERTNHKVVPFRDIHKFGGSNQEVWVSGKCLFVSPHVNDKQIRDPGVLERVKKIMKF